MMTASEEIKFILSIEEIKRIFDAGIRRGNDESTSDWGRWPTGNKYDNVIDILIDVANIGIEYTDPDYIKIDVIESWFKGE